MTRNDFTREYEIDGDTVFLCDDHSGNREHKNRYMYDNDGITECYVCECEREANVEQGCF